MSLAGGWREFGPRSLLFVPADRAEELLPNAAGSGADGIIVDLEDAVASSAKVDARRTCVAAVAAAECRVPILVRINPLGTEWGRDDIAALIEAPIAGLVLPKVETADEVMAVGKLVSSSDHILVPLIETARGVLGSAAIAAADPRVIGLAFGAEDLSAQLGVRRSYSGQELLYARSHVVLAAVASRRWVLDSPCIEPMGVDATRFEAARARALGYVGKLVIHPAQVAPVHEAFAPTVAEVAAATQVVAAFAAMTRDGTGVGNLDGRMIDKPVVAAAQRVLDQSTAGRATREERQIRERRQS